MFRTRARDTAAFVALLQHRGWAGRADLRRTLVRDRRRGRRARACCGLRRADARRRRRPGPRSSQPPDRHAPPRARAGPRGARPGLDTIHIGAPGTEHAETLEATCDSSVLRRPRADAPRARVRSRRLRAQERLQRDRRRSLRRHRLRRRRRARCGSARPGARPLVSMPSRYSSEATRSDAQRLAESLGSRLPGDRDRADGRDVPRRTLRGASRSATRI